MDKTWVGRMDVVEELEAQGWTGDLGYETQILRSSGAVWAITNTEDDSSVSGPGGWTVDLPADVPSAIVIALCTAAAQLPTNP